MRTKAEKLFALLIVMVTALASFAVGRQTAPTMNIKLDNAKVTVTESLTPAGGRRDPYTRPTDQIIIFLDDAEYDSIDGAGKATARRRRSGDIVWHTKGEEAPQLANKGKAYRNLIVALK
ncbi:MAG TPA: hypothetical protein VM866_03695 [Pyrinomonadaceae bacterium]|jgi:hypothetical protein|nr:hypothetical protein [Pyrinomonadaceae bacterium]